MAVTVARVAGHFGEFLQGRLGAEGPVALVTLPCPALAVTARRSPGPHLHLHGGGQRLLSPAHARAFLTGLGLPARGRVSLRADMPVGGGAGASTAALVALARAGGFAGDPARLARATVATEGASDPLMFDAPARLLWASREGRILARLPAPPAFDVIGGFAGAPQRTRADDRRFPDIADLVPLWAEAAERGDRAALARLASTSADRSLTLRGGIIPPFGALVQATGALGHAIAHTGSARALLFAPGTIPPGTADLLREAGLRRIVRFRTGEVR
ncbi:MAG: propanediol utilization protein [Defluviimonas denitrificans]